MSSGTNKTELPVDKPVGGLETQPGLVFVTVGTTSFDALVAEVDSSACHHALSCVGFSRLIIQKGRGKYTPDKSLPYPPRLPTEWLDFTPSIAPLIQRASLVISHAGSGSVFESLRAGKPLIVVVNEALMDNHQSELAGELAAQGHLVCASPASLVDTIVNWEAGRLKPYPAQEGTAIARRIDDFMGFR